MIALLRQVSDAGNSEGARWAGMRMHRIASAMMTELGYSSKLNAEGPFLTMLRTKAARALTPSSRPVVPTSAGDRRSIWTHSSERCERDGARVHRSCAQPVDVAVISRLEHPAFGDGVRGLRIPVPLVG
jgi:hypothetical protein